MEKEYLLIFFNIKDISLSNKEIIKLYNRIKKYEEFNLFNKIENFYNILFERFILNKKDNWLKICSKIGGIICGNKVKQDPNSYIHKKGRIPWNKGTHGLYSSWCKGKNKYNDARLMKLSIDRMGDKNPCSYKNHPDRLDANQKQSNTMKEKILNGTFTPNTTNRLTHRLLQYKNKKFRSSWEVVFYYENQSLEYETKRIIYYLNNKKHIYIADFFDPTTNTIFEVKPDRLMNIVQKEKYDVIKEYCIKSGLKFIHIGDEYIKNINLENTDIPENILKLFKNGLK